MSEADFTDQKYEEVLRKISYGAHDKSLHEAGRAQECLACMAREAITPSPQARPAPWYICTRCGLFYQSIYGCGCPAEGAPKEGGVK